MELKETIVVARHHHSPSGILIDRPSISDNSIDYLMTCLDQEGIDINPGLSEKTTAYTLRGQEPKVATVPLETEFPIPHQPRHYVLRTDNGLELEILNYDNTTLRPPKGMIGGSVAGEYGVQCIVRLQAQEVDVSIVKKVRTAMEKTYNTDI